VTTAIQIADPDPRLPELNSSSSVAARASIPQDVADAFFARYAGSTLRTYRLKLDAFSRWLGVAIEELPAMLMARGATGVHLDVERYRAYLRDQRHAAPATINGHLAAIRSLMRFMRRAQLCQWTLDVASEKSRAYRDTRGPGLPAVRAMLRAAARQADPRKATRDVAIIRLLNDLGLRRSELVGLDIPDHVERADGTLCAIRIRGKGSTERVRLTLPPKTSEALRAWIENRGLSEGPLFISVDPGAGRAGRGGRARAPNERLSGEGVARILAVLAHRANIMNRVRPHGLRHTAITALLDHGAGLRETQRFSRHADPRTLMRYDDNRADIAGEMANQLSELL
jgi:integrase/recombinase XerC